jgi:hypothetical protein
MLAPMRKKAKTVRIGVSPYGFAWLRGRLVMDPKEIEIVQLIIKLWQSGQKFSAIARHLNGLRKRTRSGSQWEHSLVRKIVLRYQNNSNQIEEIIKWASINSSK